MKNEKITVYKVLPESIAEEAGVEQGDTILSINGEKVKDIFDYRFLITAENLMLKIQKGNSEIWEIEIEKDEYEDLGIEFESSMIDEAKSCKNKCIFCFIDQLPKGMRDTLYFKDDDSRLSFLMGNYITLTNMNSDDIDRIIRYRMSPINVSVHTTNKDLRVFMLKNKSAGDILKKIEMLTDGGITVNCQIVLCRGINDSSELDKSIEDLAFLYPGINSISVVPVGITQHREGLYSLKPFDKATAKQVVKQINGWQKKLLKRYGSKIVYIADEFYLMAEEEIPQFEHYDDFPQIENGVGLIAMFKKEFFEYLEGIRSIDNIQVRNVSIATGSAAFKFIKYLAETLEKRYGNISVNVYEIKNNFFGENVTVTGLLTGTDIAAQLEGKPLGDNLLLCKSMLKSGEKLFLDDYTIEELERYLNVKIQLVENSGSDFIEKITGQLTEGQLTEDGYDVGAGSPRPCQ